MKKLLLGVLLVLGLLGVAYADSTPVIISFQGQLRENSVPVSGNRTMHFRILDVSSNIVWQSNAALATQVTVAVSNGIYTVGLGDTALANMAALTKADIDQNKKLFLRVRVGTEDLTPDILLSAVPFAYIAKQAETITQNITAGNSVVLALRQATQNVGIGNTNPVNLLQVSTNALVVSSNGRVGVGTTNVQEQLDVAGRVRLNQTTAPGTTTDKLYNVGGNLFWNGVTLNAGASATGNSQWTTTASSAIYFSSGNVGIGTKAPISDLEIRKDAASALGPVLAITNYPGGGGAGGAIDYRTYVLDINNQPEIRIQSYDNNYSADLIIYSKAPGAAANPLIERMRILNNGNFGIANAAPTNLFQVSTNALVVSSNGHVGISTTNTTATLIVDGGIVAGPSAVSLTADNQLVTIGDRSFLIISSNSGTATSRTFCLTAGVNAGQILYILNNDNGNSAQMIDGAQTCGGGPATLKLNSNYSLGGGGDTITLIYDGVNWNELSRSAN